MSERITVGDLVMVVRGHRCQFERLGGVIFVVQRIIDPNFGGYRCPACSQHSIAPHSQAAERCQGCCVPLPWLKKIRPLDEPETTERDESLTV